MRLHKPSFMRPSPTVPDGNYKGEWGGHDLKFSVFGYEVWATTKRGVRTPCVPVCFIVRNDAIVEDSIKPLVECEEVA